MKTFLSRIQRFLPLSEIEEGFYLLHYSAEKKTDGYLQLELSTPELTNSFRGLYRMSSSGQVHLFPESSFFTPEQNVALNFHHRYMPQWLHRHDFIEVQYMLTGHLRQTIGGHPVSLSAGDVCFISPDAAHDPQIYDRDSLMINLLLRLDTFHQTFSNSLAEDDIISSFFMRVLYGKGNHPYLLCHTGEDPRLQNLLLDMLDVQDAPDPYTDRLLRTMFEQFFIYLLRDHKDNFASGAFRKKTDENILSILRYIQNHYTTVTLSDLAKRFNYDEAYLSRMIHAYTGTSFSQALIDLRLQQAAALLRSSDQSVADIMGQVGYSDKTHFYRAFRKKFGTTPAQYRVMPAYP